MWHPSNILTLLSSSFSLRPGIDSCPLSYPTPLSSFMQVRSWSRARSTDHPCFPREGVGYTHSQEPGQILVNEAPSWCMYAPLHVLLIYGGIAPLLPIHTLISVMDLRGRGMRWGDTPIDPMSWLNAARGVRGGAGKMDANGVLQRSAYRRQQCSVGA